MNRPAILPSVVVLALVLSACASEPIAPPPPSIAVAPVPMDIGEAVELAQSQRRVGDLGAATATMSQLVLVAPDDPRVLGEYGKILLDRGEAIDALAFLQRAIELNPGEWSFHSAQGVGFAQRGDFRSAQMAFGRALMLNPNDPVVLNNFALAHLQSGNLEQAEALLLRASLSAETFPKVAQNLALVRKMRGDAPLEAPTPQVFPTAVLSAPPEEMPESGAAAPMHGTEAASPEESPAPADVEVTEVQDPLAEVTESSVVKSDVDAPNADLADSVDDPIIENEVIETVALEAPEPVEEAVQEIVAPIEKPAQQEAVVETVASDVVEPLPAAPVWDIWIPSSGPIYLQVGAFSSDENAARMVEKLEILEPQMASANAGERMIHRIVVGPYANRDETHVALAALTEFGIDDVQVLTRLPGVVQQRDDIAEAAPSAAPADKVASENVTVPGGSTSLSYVDSF